MTFRLPPELIRPQVIPVSEAQIDDARQAFHQMVHSFALEGHEPDDFGKVVIMERIRGEITPEQAEFILCRTDPVENKRIEIKIIQLQKHGLSWRDL